MSLIEGKLDPDKKVKEGWIRSTMMIEVLAVNKDSAKSALEGHVKKMEMVKTSHIYKKDFKGFIEVEKPFPNIDKAYSYVVELEMVSKNFEALIFMVMNYAPSSVEILEPKELKVDIGQAQSTLISISEMMHKFARAGLGGVVINA
jgi:hypothetical protein